MFLMRFTERAYVNYTAEDVKNSPNSAVRLTFSKSHFDPRLGADLYNTYLDEYKYSEEVGFVGIGGTRWLCACAAPGKTG
jgi:hypothetical protein